MSTVHDARPVVGRRIPSADGLEHRLGDPADPHNPTGLSAILAADEAGVPLHAGERLLDDWGVNAEIVPRGLGGRFEDTGALVRRLRPLFRRDITLGLDVVSSFPAALAVFRLGSPKQRHQLATMLLAGGRVSFAHPGPEPDDERPDRNFAADPRPGGFLLHGRGDALGHGARMTALVLAARAGVEPAGRHHGLFLLDDRHLRSSAVRVSSGPRLSGVRGAAIGGVVIDALEVPGDTVVGPARISLDDAWCSTQVTRIAVPSMTLAALDAALRAVVGFAGQRRLYGDVIGVLPHVRATLAGVFVDLLIADCLVTTAANCLHLHPEQASTYAAVVEYLIPRIVDEAMRDLCLVLGARFYLRDGSAAIVGKHLRDLPAVAMTHPGTADGAQRLAGMLPALARHGWRQAEAVTDVFAVTASLPPLDLNRLRPAPDGADVVGASLLSAGARPNVEGTDDPVTGRIVELAGRLAALRRQTLRQSAGAPPPWPTVAAVHAAQSYALLMAAASCIGVRAAAEGSARVAFLNRPGWLSAALERIEGRLGGRPVALSHRHTEELFSELTVRYRQQSAFDVRADAVAG